MNTRVAAGPGSALAARDLLVRRGAREGGFELCVEELEILAGGVLAVLGPNGAGKSTLLRTLAAVGALDEDWELQVRALGIPPPQRAWLLVREIRLGVLAAVIAALGGILSEVGAVSAVGGNLEGETRVLTTAVLMYTQMGEFGLALSMAAVLLGMTLVLAGLLTVVQQGGQGGRS